MGAPSSEVPTDANHNCPGTESEQAGKSSACAGCPNQSICSTGQVKAPDPDIPIITKRLEGIQHKILVLSGKGGVGKSTFTSQLSFALASSYPDDMVGIMDIDICGPSQPKILGVEGEQVHQSGSGWEPVSVDDNLCVMSIGFMLPSQDDAVIWRGPKKNGLIKQFLKDVDWSDTKYLLVDTPPGTTDEHISIAQYMRGAGVTGAIIVTTPQEVAISDVRKEINFCRKVKIPILGIVENMSGFVCPNCHGQSFIFKPTTGGGKKLAEEYGVPFLGSIPLDPRIGKCCDLGLSFLEQHPDSPAAAAYVHIINQLKERMT